MKTLEKLAIWFLRNRKVTVVIGCDITDTFIKAKNNDSYLYENDWKDIDFRLRTGEIFIIPRGSFKIESIQD